MNKIFNMIIYKIYKMNMMSFINIYKSVNNNQIIKLKFYI